MAFLRRIIPAIILLACLTGGLYFWQKSAAKDLPSDPSALMISLTVAAPDSYTEGSPPAEPVTVRFTNRSEMPVKILKPVAGSDRGLSLPFYSLTLISVMGTEVPFDTSSPLELTDSSLRWPEDYVVEIAPRDSYEVTLPLNRRLPIGGRYKISFSYTFDPDNTGVRGSANRMVYPRGLWIGTAKSDTIQADLTPWKPKESDHIIR